MIDLTGKRIVVLAGTKGIGYGVSEFLLKSGANVFFCSRSEANVRDTLNSLSWAGDRVSGATCNLTKADSIEQFFAKVGERYGRINGLFFNTGGPPPGRFEEIPLDLWDITYELLVRSAVKATQEALKIAERESSFVYLTSVAVKEPVPNLILSNSIRMSILGLVKTLSKEVTPDTGIRFNVVMPGYIRTQRVEEVARSRATKMGKKIEDVMSEMVSNVPLKRMGEPWEVGALVAFLMSDLSKYINGAAIPIDGGLLNSII